MPSPEQFYQPGLPNTFETDQRVLTVQVTTSSRMEQVITYLATAYDVDLSQKGANLYLNLPDQTYRWMIANIDGERIGVTRCQIDEENRLAPDLDMVFAVTPSGWEPVEIVHTNAVWEEYAKSIPINESQTEAPNDFSFATFADRVAQALEQQVRSHTDQTRGTSTLGYARTTRAK